MRPQRGMRRIEPERRAPVGSALLVWGRTDRSQTHSDRKRSTSAREATYRSPARADLPAGPDYTSASVCLHVATVSRSAKGGTWLIAISFRLQAARFPGRQKDLLCAHDLTTTRGTSAIQIGGSACVLLDCTDHSASHCNRKTSMPSGAPRWCLGSRRGSGRCCGSRRTARSGGRRGCTAHDLAVQAG